jgi:hypothetical protein
MPVFATQPDVADNNGYPINACGRLEKLEPEKGDADSFQLIFRLHGRPEFARTARKELEDLFGELQPLAKAPSSRRAALRMARI